mmetsp:Transcript_52260/g.126302  ORF Transcript_52260/g.126302 Transcript_52260/m.126302 type:complete len:1212 (-) Transcript_52260:2307-5942(-)
MDGDHNLDRVVSNEDGEVQDEYERWDDDEEEEEGNYRYSARNRSLDRLMDSMAFYRQQMEEETKQIQQDAAAAAPVTVTRTIPSTVAAAEVSYEGGDEGEGEGKDEDEDEDEGDSSEDEYVYSDGSDYLYSDGGDDEDEHEDEHEDEDDDHSTNDIVGEQEEEEVDPTIESYLETARNSKSLQRMFDHLSPSSDHRPNIKDDVHGNCNHSLHETVEKEEEVRKLGVWSCGGKDDNDTIPSRRRQTMPSPTNSTRPLDEQPFYIVHLYNLEPVDFLGGKGQQETQQKRGDFVACTMSDGHSKSRCFISASSLSEAKDGTQLSLSSSPSSQMKTQLIVSVQGFVLVPVAAITCASTEYFHDDNKGEDESDCYGENNPWVCVITRYQILHQHSCRRFMKENQEKKKAAASLYESTVMPQAEEQKSDCAFPFNKRGSLLWQQSPLDLYTLPARLVDKSARVSHFLEQHHTLMSLQKKQINSSSPLLGGTTCTGVGAVDTTATRQYLPGGHHSITSAVKNYSSSVNEHETLERQTLKNTKLYTISCGGGCNDTVERQRLLEQAKTQADETLDYALKCSDEALSPELLLRWHAWLAGDGLYPEAGAFRTSANSCSPDCILDQVSDFCDTLENSWLSFLKGRSYDCAGITTFAVVSMLNFYRCAPFEHGNANLSKVVFQWCLRRAGFPFCVHFVERAEAMSVLDSFKAACEFLSIVPCGIVSNTDISAVSRLAGTIDVLIESTIENMAQSIDSFSVAVSKKAACASDVTEARIVRKAREQASESTCIICFDESPNIATLCCGKPVHFHCMGEWLKRSSNSSCPQCRSHIQSCTTRARSTNLSSTINLVSDDDSSAVDELLHYITNDSDIDSDSSDDDSSSSSSSDSSSSSSSFSSSSSSAFVYNELHYSLNYTTSDEDEDEDDNSSSVPTDDIETDTDNYFAPDDDTDAQHSEWSSHPYQAHEGELEAIASMDDIYDRDPIILDDSTILASIIDGFQDPLALRNLGDGEHEQSEVDNQSSGTSFMSASQSPPRMSFLDQALLDDVNFGNTASHTSEDERPTRLDRRSFSPFRSDSSDEDDDEAIYDSHSSEEDEVPEFTRPADRQSQRILSLMRAQLRLAERRTNREALIAGGRWIPSSQRIPSDSEVYDSETYQADDDDVTTEEESASATLLSSPLATFNRRVAMTTRNRSISNESASLAACDADLNQDVSSAALDG